MPSLHVRKRSRPPTPREHSVSFSATLPPDPIPESPEYFERKSPSVGGGGESSSPGSSSFYSSSSSSLSASASSSSKPRSKSARWPSRKSKRQSLHLRPASAPPIVESVFEGRSSGDDDDDADGENDDSPPNGEGYGSDDEHLSADAAAAPNGTELPAPAPARERKSEQVKRKLRRKLRTASVAAQAAAAASKSKSGRWTTASAAKQRQQHQRQQHGSRSRSTSPPSLRRPDGVGVGGRRRSHDDGEGEGDDGVDLGTSVSAATATDGFAGAAVAVLGEDRRGSAAPGRDGSRGGGSDDPPPPPVAAAAAAAPPSSASSAFAAASLHVHWGRREAPLSSAGEPVLGRSLRRTSSVPDIAFVFGDDDDEGGRRDGEGDGGGGDCRAALSDDCDDRKSVDRRTSGALLSGGEESAVAVTAVASAPRTNGSDENDDNDDERVDADVDGSAAASASAYQRWKRWRDDGPHLGKRKSHRRKYKPSPQPDPPASGGGGDGGDGDDSWTWAGREGVVLESGSVASDDKSLSGSASSSLGGGDAAAAAAAPSLPLEKLRMWSSRGGTAAAAPSISARSVSSFSSAPPVLATSSQPSPLPRTSLKWSASTVTAGSSSAATFVGGTSSCGATLVTTSTGGSGGSRGSGDDRHPSIVGGSGHSRKPGSGPKERRVKPHSAYGKTYLTEEELVKEMLLPSATFEEPTTGGALKKKKKKNAGRKKGKKADSREWMKNGRRRERSVSADNLATSVPLLGKPPPGDGHQRSNSNPIDSAGDTHASDADGGGDDEEGDDDDGRIGTLSVEVLSCVGLPKFDRFSKPDVRAYALLGDSAFATDAIPSCLSPMWPRKARRAAAFPIHHAYARLYVGVFGVNNHSRRKEKKEKNDDFAGRVCVDVSALRPGTEYDVTMPLRSSTHVYDKRRRGAVRLRLKLEWRSERAAVLSYLKSPARVTASAGGGGGRGRFRGGAGSLAIPCADAKTFRNVALTVHGEHLPGKYDRKAFRSAATEAKLYNIQLKYVGRALLNDAVTYERPLVSLYLFGAWMHCVYAASVALAPSYFVGYLIFLFMNNYVAFHLDEDRHGGYQSADITEIGRALVRGGKVAGDGADGVGQGVREQAIRPLSVERRTPILSSGDGDGPIEAFHGGGGGGGTPSAGRIRLPVDHAEFPFSQRRAYPRPSILDAVVQRSKSSANSSVWEKRSVSRLSDTTRSGKYGSQYRAERDWTMSNEGVGAGEVENDDDDSIPMDDIDAEIDSEDEEDEDDDEEDVFAPDSLFAGTHRSLFVFSSDPLGRSILVGPEQDADNLPKRKTVKQTQQNVARFENRLHNLTFRLFDDRVAVDASYREQSSRRDSELSQQGGASNGKKSEKKKKTAADDFDRRLGLQSGKQNPLLALTAGYLGPVMNILRIWLCIVRVSFNVASWTDPFLSFWILSFLIVLAVVLAVFPWRAFMLVSGIVLVGPQNMILKRIARRVNENAPQGDESASMVEAPLVEGDASDAPEADTVGTVENATGLSGVTSKKTSRRAKFRISTRKQKSKTSSLLKQDSAVNSDEETLDACPLAFSAQSGKLAQKTLKKSLAPRSVIIPYSRLRKERFYDWPPDPNVSRAVPIAKDPVVIDQPHNHFGVPEEIPFGKESAPKEQLHCDGPRKRLYTR